MKQLTSEQQLSRLAMAHLRRGVLTNHFPEKERLRRAIARGDVCFEAWDGGVVFCETIGALKHLTYYLNELSAAPALALPDGCVLEFAAKPDAPETPALRQFWRGQGFSEILIRRRLARGAITPRFDGVLRASEDDFDEVRALLHDSFSPITGCLPPDGELRRRLREGRFLLRREGGTLAALLEYAPAKTGVEIRHVAVAPEFRGRHFADPLLAALEGACRVWAAQDNPAANAMYLRSGFSYDGYRSYVYQKGL